MRVGIIGAGIAGLTIAHDVQKAGHQVVIFEGGDRVGGLAAGFKDAGWAWELEKFYHHWFQSDHDILNLIEELGLSDQVIFPRPKTSMWSKGKIYLFDNPFSMLLYPDLPLIPKLRFGLVGLYLRLTKNWRAMESSTAEAWLRRTMGDVAYETLWRPMLIGKFGPLYQQVTMAWFWARVHTRTVKLGTYRGGFQKFLDTFAAKLRQNGIEIRLQAPVQHIISTADSLVVQLADGQHESFDRVVSTTSPTAMLKLVSDLPSPYADQLRNLKQMGAAVVVLALKQQFLTDGTYWLNLPASSPDKANSEFPFLALVEHTNYMQSEDFGGDHILYCGDYVATDHEYLRMNEDELAERFIAALSRINPNFRPEWIRKRWVFRSTYAQPIPFVNHSRNIPSLRTPITGLYLACMSQIYPWDRGTNYAVQLAHEVARHVIQDIT